MLEARAAAARPSSSMLLLSHPRPPVAPRPLAAPAALGPPVRRQHRRLYGHTVPAPRAPAPAQQRVRPAPCVAAPAQPRYAAPPPLHRPPAAAATAARRLGRVAPRLTAAAAPAPDPPVGALRHAPPSSAPPGARAASHCLAPPRPRPTATVTAIVLLLGHPALLSYVPTAAAAAAALLCQPVPPRKTRAAAAAATQVAARAAGSSQRPSLRVAARQLRSWSSAAGGPHAPRRRSPRAASAATARRPAAARRLPSAPVQRRCRCLRSHAVASPSCSRAPQTMAHRPRARRAESRRPALAPAHADSERCVSAVASAADGTGACAAASCRRARRWRAHSERVPKLATQTAQLAREERRDDRLVGRHGRQRHRCHTVRLGEERGRARSHLRAPVSAASPKFQASN